MQIKTTMKYDFIPIKNQQQSKKTDNWCVVKDIEKLKPLGFSGKDVN